MSRIPEEVVPLAQEVVPLAKGAQVLNLIRENQLITAVIVFVLWQAGALQSGIGLIGGVC